MKGTVKFFNTMKGFGFIAGEDGKEYFVHLTGLKEGVRINENDTVEFDVEQGDRGPKAVNVSKASAESSEPAEDSMEPAESSEPEGSDEDSDEESDEDADENKESTE